MKKKLILIGIMVLLVVTTVSILSQNFVPNRDRTVISGEVLRIGELPSDGSNWRFRLVKYRVHNVCQGTYKNKEIIVSHFPEEVEKIKKKSEVCVVITKSEGPNINEDWSIDLKGKDTHYITDGLLINNCTCK